MTSFTGFENCILVAAYRLADERDNDDISLRDIFETYEIEYKDAWLHRVLRSLVDSHYSDDVRTLGSDPLDQEISLTPLGFKRGEELSTYVRLDRVEAMVPASTEDETVEINTAPHAVVIQQPMVVHRLEVALREIENLGLSNEETAQAKAYVAAALSIAQAPDPNWELVKDILLVASAVATVGGLIVGILALL